MLGNGGSTHCKARIGGYTSAVALQHTASASAMIVHPSDTESVALTTGTDAAYATRLRATLPPGQYSAGHRPSTVCVRARFVFGHMWAVRGRTAVKGPLGCPLSAVCVTRARGRHAPDSHRTCVIDVTAVPHYSEWRQAIIRFGKPLLTSRRWRPSADGTSVAAGTARRSAPAAALPLFGDGWRGRLQAWVVTGC
jgi:hypothetical protein